VIFTRKIEGRPPRLEGTATSSTFIESVVLADFVNALESRPIDFRSCYADIV
jgi:hypothetical protein